MDTQKKEEKQKGAEDSMLLEIQTMLDGAAQEQNLDDEKQRFKESLEHLQLQYKLNLQLLQDIHDQRALFESAKEDFNEAYKKVNGIVTSITNAITNAQNCHIEVQLKDEAKHQLEQRNAEVVNTLTTFLTEFKFNVEGMFRRQSIELTKITERTEGVYFSNRLFGWLLVIWIFTEGVLLCQFTIMIYNLI